MVSSLEQSNVLDSSSNRISVKSWDRCMTADSARFQTTSRERPGWFPLITQRRRAWLLAQTGVSDGVLVVALMMVKAGCVAEVRLLILLMLGTATLEQ